MSQRSGFFESGLDRIRETVESASKELRRVQKQVDARRKALEKRVATQRRALEKRAQQRFDRVASRLRRSSLLKNAEAVREGATRQIEAGVESMLQALQIASRSDLERIDRKLSQLSRKLKDIEKGSEAAA